MSKFAESTSAHYGYRRFLHDFMPLCMVCTLMAVSLVLPARAARFRRYTIEDGLSQNSVFALVQDQHGFLWVGTLEGLNRFDGYSFKQYKNSPSDPGSLSDNLVQSMARDSQGRIWVGTAAGINLYDEASDKFLHYNLASNEASALEILSLFVDRRGQLWVGTQKGLIRYLPGEDRFLPTKLDRRETEILAIHQDNLGNLWLGTRDGLLRYNIETARTMRYQVAQFSDLPSNNITTVLPDGTGGMWVGTKAGLTRFFPEHDTFQTYQSGPEFPRGPAGADINTLFKDASDNLWVGFRSEGLDRLDQNTGAFVHYRADPTDRESLSHNGVICLLQDISGILWIGTDVGLNKYDPNTEDFGLARRLTSDRIQSGTDDIRSLYVSRHREVWLGTYGQGLTRHSLEKNQFENFRHDPKRSDSLAGDIVWMVGEDRQNQLWIGTDSGLNRWLGADKFFTYPTRQEQPTGIAHPTVYTQLQDPLGRLWFGTADGLSRYRPESDDFETVLNDPDLKTSLSSNRIWSLALGPNGHLWVGTGNAGLNDYDPESGKALRYSFERNNSKALPNDKVYCLLPNSENNALWIGTHAGLAYLDYNDRESFRVYTEGDGLPSSTICALQQDNHSQLWISTKRGLACLQTESGQIKVYKKDDGLQNDEFNENASFKDGGGQLYFGGVEGYNAFFGERIKPDPMPPKLKITELYLFNRLIHPSRLDKSSPLPGPMANVRKLKLTHRDKMISFEMAALHLAHPDQNLYAYMLEGLDSGWVRTTANKRYATYTSLPPGAYVFRAKAANRDGRWGEEVSVALEIEPPPWHTWWAHALYILGALGFITWYLVQVRNKLERERQLAAQIRRVAEQDQLIIEQERKTALRLREIDRLKDEFLANTSHELRTPLNGIIGLAEALLEAPSLAKDEDALTSLELVISSGKHLSTLVNDILDFSKLKSCSLVLNCKPTHVYRLVQRVLSVNQPAAQRKQLVFENNIPQDLPMVHADETRLLQIFQNLVGNAIKFTHSGRVTLDSSLEVDGVHFTISDTGIGIPKAKLERIFESFEQADGSSERQFGGSGLGLSISRLLVALHGGEIAISSKIDQGTQVAFNLPLSQEQETTGGASGQFERLEGTSATTQAAPEPAAHAVLDHEIERAHILVVDDEPINRRILISMLLAENFRITEAEDGPTALILLEHSGPFDMVLLDVMMPLISGFDVCRRIRETHGANELPIIILTAKNQPEDLVCGFESGANDYLAKPVIKTELLARVRTHLSLLNNSRLLEDQVRDRTRELMNKNDDLVRTHQQMVVQEKMVSLGVLTAGISHEINNPTNFVFAGVQNLKADLDKFTSFLAEITENEDPEIMADIHAKLATLNQHACVIFEGAGRIRGIVRDLHIFSQASEPENRRVDLVENLTSTMNLVSAQFHDHVEFCTEFRDYLVLQGNTAELNQVFLNLIINACQSIKARVEKEELSLPARLTVRTYREANKGVVEFEDQGMGISNLLKNRIFEPFFTTKPVGEGTGMGLSIAYGIMEQHGGQIEVVDHEGPGVTFRLIFRLEPPKTQRAGLGPPDDLDDDT